LLRHERDAARGQIDALMQLTAQLKTEIAAAQTPPSGATRTAATEAAVISANSAAQARVTQLEAELTSTRETSANAMGAALADRDRALASLSELDAAMRNLQAGYDRLAARVAEADEALSSRDRLLAEARQAALEENAAAQTALRAVHDDLDSRTETMRQLGSTVAALEAEQKSMLADLERIRVERDDAVQAERAGREERDTISARLQSLDSHQRPAGDADLLKAERDHLAARISDLQAALDTAKSTGDGAAQELARAQGELAGAMIEVGSLRAALETARADLGQKDELLAALPGLQARLAVAEARVAELDRPVTPAASEVVPAATWTVVEDNSMVGVDPTLRDELAAALARIKDLGGRVVDSERRAAELERYLADRAPPPPPAAPR
jgi:chromosome segregation ATPase